MMRRGESRVPSQLTNGSRGPNINPMKSMTGFGRASFSSGVFAADVEILSVNRKQLEIVVNAQRSLLVLETKIRQACLPLISRGRVQIAIKLEKADGQDSGGVRLNAGLAKSFEQAFHELGHVVGRPLLPTAADFLRQPGILEIGDSESIDPDAAWAAISPALESALVLFDAMRGTEGGHLRADFIDRLEGLAELTKRIADAAPGRPLRQRELLLKRLSDLNIAIDLGDERLTKELALFADRCDISEELTRLDSHFSKFRGYLDAPEPAGRPLDFLCQELFREFNTIGSKANDAVIAQTVVEAKTELEKLREQIQNIE